MTEMIKVYAFIIDKEEAFLDCVATKKHDPKGKINQVAKCDGFFGVNCPDDEDYFAFLFYTEHQRDEAFKLASALFKQAWKIQSAVEIEKPIMH